MPFFVLIIQVKQTLRRKTEQTANPKWDCHQRDGGEDNEELYLTTSFLSHRIILQSKILFVIILLENWINMSGMCSTYNSYFFSNKMLSLKFFKRFLIHLRTTEYISLHCDSSNSYKNLILWYPYHLNKSILNYWLKLHMIVQKVKVSKLRSSVLWAQIDYILI